MRLSGESDSGNDWHAIVENARTGHLEFDDGIALEAAELASDVIGGVRAVRAVVEELEIPSLSNLRSGAALALKFNDSGARLARILGQHIEILENLVDLFIAAGRTYAEAEDRSVAGFDNISVPREAVELQGPPPTAGASYSREFTRAVPYTSDHLNQFVYEFDQVGESPESVQFPESLEELRDTIASSDEGGLVPSSIMAEDIAVDAMTYRQLYDFGQSIIGAGKNVPDVVSDSAGRWSWISGKLEDIYSSFMTNLDSSTVDRWEGEGKEAVVTAIREYAAGVRELVRRTGFIGENLHYTAEWLRTTAVHMPQSPEDSDLAGWSETGRYSVTGGTGTSSDSALSLQTYRENMKKTYLTGLPQSAESIPELLVPGTVFGDPRDTSTEQGGDDHAARDNMATGNGGDAGGPSFGGSAPIVPPGAVGEMPGPGGSGGQPGLPVLDWGRPPAQEGLGARESAEEASQQAADQAARQASQQASQQAAQLAQQLGQAAAAAQQPPVGDLVGPGPSVVPGLSNAAKPAGAGTPGGGGSAGAAAPGGSSPARTPLDHSKLFPRANTVASAGLQPGRAGLAGSGMGPAGTPMAPGSPGAAGRGAGQGGEKEEYKRPASLNSAEHLEEAFGTAPRTVRPVVEE